MKTPKDLRPLIDADYMPYRFGFSADAGMRNELKSNNPDITDEQVAEALASTDYESHALHGAKDAMEMIVGKFNPEYRLYLQDDSVTTYRYALATILPYKGNRADFVKPKYHKHIKQYLFDVWNAIPVRHIETDDAVALEQFDNPDKTTVIVSQDKDLKMIPGWHFDPVKEYLYYQTIKDANNWLFWQMLVGDRSDNIPGIKGIGETRANKLLELHKGDTDAIREEVKKYYQRDYGTDWERAYQEVGSLLWILRKPEEQDKGSPLL